VPSSGRAAATPAGSTVDACLDCRTWHMAAGVPVPGALHVGSGLRHLMACAGRLRLRLLRADDAVLLRSVMEPALVEAVVAQTGNRPLTPWAIVLSDGGGVAGFCGFFVRPVKGITTGYRIVPECRGRGLATEAAAAVLDWAERNGVDFYSSVRPRILPRCVCWKRSECGWSTPMSTKAGSATSTVASRCANAVALRANTALRDGAGDENRTRTISLGSL